MSLRSTSPHTVHLCCTHAVRPPLCIPALTEPYTSPCALCAATGVAVDTTIKKVLYTSDSWGAAAVVLEKSHYFYAVGNGTVKALNNLQASPRTVLDLART